MHSSNQSTKIIIRAMRFVLMSFREKQAWNKFEMKDFISM